MSKMAERKAISVCFLDLLHQLAIQSRAKPTEKKYLIAIINAVKEIEIHDGIAGVYNQMGRKIGEAEWDKILCGVFQIQSIEQEALTEILYYYPSICSITKEDYETLLSVNRKVSALIEEPNAKIVSDYMDAIHELPEALKRGIDRKWFFSGFILPFNAKWPSFFSKVENEMFRLYSISTSRTNTNTDRIFTASIRLGFALALHLILFGSSKVVSYGPEVVNFIVAISIVAGMAFQMWIIQTLLKNTHKLVLTGWICVLVDWFIPIGLAYATSPTYFDFGSRGLGNMAGMYVLVNMLMVWIFKKTFGMWLLKLRYSEESKYDSFGGGLWRPFSQLTPVIFFATCLSHIAFLVVLALSYKSFLDGGMGMYEAKPTENVTT